MLLINIHIPIVSFHKYDKILAAELYGDLQWLALRACYCKSPFRSAASILSTTCHCGRKLERKL